MYGNTNHLHHECTWKNRRIIIDAAEITPDNFEIMVMYKSSGKEIEVSTARSLEEAEQIYKEYCTKYEQKLTGKYLKLKEDLQEALNVALKAVEGVEDNGTCNLDACAITLPRWQESLVRQAAKEAGTHCFTWDCYGKSFVFCTPNVGQANRNSAAAEAMTQHMKSAGYQAFDYCQMD